MQYEFRPSGVCFPKIVPDVDGDTVQQVRSVGGCSGDSQGIGVLVQGMKIDDMIRRLQGIRCGRRNAPRPDQFTQASLLHQSKNETKDQALLTKEESANFRDKTIPGREVAQEYLPYP